MTTALVAVPLAAALVVVLVMVWRARATLAELAAQGQRHEAQGAMMRSETKRLAAAMDALGEGLIVLDEHDRIVANNAAARELAALDPGTIGRALAEVLPWPTLHQVIARCRRTGAPAVGELEASEAGGRVMAIRVRTLDGSGIVIGIDDQSRLRRLESLRRDFVANVSHELKTPLAAIQGFVETMQDDPQMPLATRMRFLDRIGRQTDRLTTLVGDLLTLSRLDDDPAVGRDADPCDVVAVVRETVKDLLPLAERRGVQLLASIPGASMHAAADHEALRQVAGNLIDNAIKYTPKDGRVDVVLQEHGERLRLEVRDTGIGLSAADQERVFERFYRVDRARSRELGGTGLGLSIVKNTVKNLGGEVGVRSELGKGSTFWVELPRSARPPSP